jgi:tetratricopeptide (TPR) repeat protein
VLVAVYENPRDAASLTYVRSDSVDQYLTGVWDAEARDVGFYLEQLAYHEREKRPNVVLAAAERISKSSPDAVAAERAELAKLGALRDMGQVSDALAAAKAYAERAPKSAGAQVEVGRSLLAAGQADAALAAFDAALVLDPGDLMALQLRYWPANSLTDIQAVSAAIPALEAFAQAHPEAAGAWRSLARAKWASGSKDEAVALFRKAVDITPADDELRAELWNQLGNMQQYQLIVDDASKIQNMNKRDWKLRWNEAEAYLGLGRKLEARGAFAGINFDESLHVDIRKRAKRAVKSIDEGMTLSGPSEPTEGTPAS